MGVSPEWLMVGIDGWELMVDCRQFLNVYLKWKRRKSVLKDNDCGNDDAKMSETTV